MMRHEHITRSRYYTAPTRPDRQIFIIQLKILIKIRSHPSTRSNHSVDVCGCVAASNVRRPRSNEDASRCIPNHTRVIWKHMVPESSPLLTHTCIYNQISPRQATEMGLRYGRTILGNRIARREEALILLGENIRTTLFSSRQYAAVHTETRVCTHMATRACKSQCPEWRIAARPQRRQTSTRPGST